MDKLMKRNLIMIAFGVVLYAILMNLSAVLGFVSNLGSIITPIIMALFIAFIFNVPMTGISRLLKKVMKKKGHHEGLVNLISLLITAAIFIGVIALVILIIVPQFVASIGSIIAVAEQKIPEWLDKLNDYGIMTELWKEYEQSFSAQGIIEMISKSTDSISSILAYTSSAVSAIATFSIALILCIYVLVGKHVLSVQATHVMNAFLPDKWVETIFRVGKLTQHTFSKFLRGQCLEAAILGTMIFIAFTIARLPYAPVAGVLTALLAFIPYIGAFISLAVMMLLIAMTSPIKAIIALIVYQIVQFIENHFVYPNVVGNSVGLPALWTLIAVVIGGKLFGVLGMIFFIPIVSVVYTLFRERVRLNLERKKQKVEEEAVAEIEPKTETEGEPQMAEEQ